MPIDRLIVGGYKSIKERTEVDLRGLTLLAGANSSGKSSVVQPLLLLKQTIDTTDYDPGPLLLSGPNVVFSRVDQMLWTVSGKPQSERLTFGLGISSRQGVSSSNGWVTVEVCLRKENEGGTTPLCIESCQWSYEDGDFPLKPGMTSGEIESLLPEKSSLSVFNAINGGEKGKGTATEASFRIERTRTFLYARAQSGSARFTVLPDNVYHGLVEGRAREVIHVPVLRGTPQRTYPITAVQHLFPGLFQRYTASIIANWQSDRDRKDRLGRLEKDLCHLGLTEKVRAERRSDTEVEVLVGRLPAGRRGGSRDLVGIADVGFGVSQVLPVLVALLAAAPGQCVYLEQPEIHLHPRAQAALAGPILDAVGRGVRVIVETHSEMLLLGVQKLVAEGGIDPGQAILHWFTRGDDGATRITSAVFDERGTLGDVPIDFAEVGMTAMREYLEAATPST